MKFLAPLLVLAASALAAPVAKRQTPNLFRLKTTSATNTEHNDLYVYGYHTGAGLNDAVLTKDVGTASSAYLNGTNVFFDYKTEFPWGMKAIGDTNYACEYPHPHPLKTLPPATRHPNESLTLAQLGNLLRSTPVRVATGSPFRMVFSNGRRIWALVAGSVSIFIWLHAPLDDHVKLTPDSL
jgi:hypothetical protein